MGASAANTVTRRASTESDPRASAGTATADPARAVSSTSFEDYCPAVNGLSWTLFRGKCYYRYSAPYGVEESSWKDAEKHYKTWFEAREECARLGAKLASVHDQATQEKLLELIVGNETLTRLEETTWIGLQVGTFEEAEFVDDNGDVLYKNETGCYWPVGVRPRLAKNDPCPEEAVDECSIPFNDTFHGQWEDGQLYDEDESADFWSPEEPNLRETEWCNGIMLPADDQSKAYCERGVDGAPDRLQHCALLLPPDEKHMRIRGEDRALTPGKWVDYWCWMKVRGYICERPARRFDGSEVSTSPGLETQTSATPTSCEARHAACMNRARARTDEIEREINATRTGYAVVFESMALGGAVVGTNWLGGSASFGPLAQSAIDFGRSIAKLSAEDCIPDLRRLRRQLEDLSKKMEESYKKKLYPEYRQAVRHRVQSTYASALYMLTQEDKTYRKELVTYCTSKQTPETLIMNMQACFTSPEPTDEATEDLHGNMLSDLVQNEPDSKPKVQRLMVEVDAVARLALTSLGACVEILNVSEGRQNESSNRAINALSRVNDAFKAALKNNTPPTPDAEYVVAAMNQTAKEVLDKANFGSQGWPGRDEMHKAVVNETVGRLESNMSYVFNALASLPDDRRDRQCRQFPNASVVGVSDRNVRFVVLYANKERNENAKSAWSKMKNKTDTTEAVLSGVFAESNGVLCERLDAALEKHKIKKDNFRGGVAAVKCGYEFVWYELGYTYFYAAYSSSDYKWQKKSGAYDAKCGQIFFFP